MMRRRSALVAVSVLGLLVAGCGDDADEATDSTSTTEPASTTELPTTSTAATGTTELPTTTAEAAGTTELPTTTTEASPLDLADLEGSWAGTSFAIASKEDPALTIDVIALGATLTAEVDDAGNLKGLLSVPEALGGAPEPITFSASFAILDEETMATTFDEEIPPLLTSFTGPFSFDGDTFTITDEEAVFDFFDGNGLVAATAVTVLERSSGPQGATG